MRRRSRRLMMISVGGDGRVEVDGEGLMWVGDECE